MLVCATLYLFLTFTSSVTKAQVIFGKHWQNAEDSKWFIASSGTSEDKASRYDWTGALDNPECPGNVLSLQPGEATKIMSHKHFGQKPYPHDYRVRCIETRHFHTYITVRSPLITVLSINSSYFWSGYY